jgi:predicted transcriptional regulator
MDKKLLEIAADIVKGQSAVNRMAPEEIAEALTKTFSTLQKMQKAENSGVSLGAETVMEEKAPERVDPRKSIQENKVVCLECGAQMRQLTVKHLSAHGLNPREYKRKWGFPLKQSLSAKALSKARSKAAKKRGLPENLRMYIEAHRREKADVLEPQKDAVAIKPTGRTRKKEVK